MLLLTKYLYEFRYENKIKSNSTVILNFRNIHIFSRNCCWDPNMRHVPNSSKSDDFSWRYWRWFSRWRLTFAVYVTWPLLPCYSASPVLSAKFNWNRTTGCWVIAKQFWSASLYFSKRGAYWDRLCRDVVGCWSLVVGWLVGWLVVGCHARALWPNGAS